MSEYILFATLKKQWFDMIASGTKLEEYREIKPYWTNRLFYSTGIKRPYDAVVFRNGYSAAAPTMKFKYKGFRIGLSLIHI
jgi:hypothetical protein